MYNVILFGYNFNHKKSEDFIHILKKYNINIVAYLAADSVKLNLPEKIYKKSIPEKSIFHPRELCKLYDIPFYNVAHNSKEAEEIIKNTNATLGIVSGARILKENIINLFDVGIINFHPGKIPEASGLDGLFWSIYKDIFPFMTTHFIDKQIDAGLMIYEQVVDININDRIEDIKYKINLTEKNELIKLCEEYLSQNKKIVSYKIDNYISANKPMDVITQQSVIDKFENWKKELL